MSVQSPAEGGRHYTIDSVCGDKVLLRQDPRQVGGERRGEQAAADAEQRGRHRQLPQLQSVDHSQRRDGRQGEKVQQLHPEDDASLRQPIRCDPTY